MLSLKASTVDCGRSLNQNWFLSLAEARATIESWRQDYNESTTQLVGPTNAERIRGRLATNPTRSRSGILYSNRRFWQPGTFHVFILQILIWRMRGECR